MSFPTPHSIEESVWTKGNTGANGPIILPSRVSLVVIPVGDLKPGNVVIEAGRALKVGDVRHTADGYTYWDARTLTGEPYSGTI